jgi:hypothetical protein
LKGSIAEHREQIMMMKIEIGHLLEKVSSQESEITNHKSLIQNLITESGNLKSAVELANRQVLSFQALATWLVACNERLIHVNRSHCRRLEELEEAESSCGPVPGSPITQLIPIEEVVVEENLGTVRVEDEIILDSEGEDLSEETRDFQRAWGYDRAHHLIDQHQLADRRLEGENLELARNDPSPEYVENVHKDVMAHCR